jgi:hypothetical protein
MSFWYPFLKPYLNTYHSNIGVQINAMMLDLGPVHTGSQVLSPKYDMDAHVTTIYIWRWGSELVLRVGSSKKLDPTLNTSPVNNSTQNNQDPTLMIINHILTFSWCSKIESLPPCWELGPLLGNSEPAGSYRWTGWVWKITSWSLKLHENYRSF